MLRKLEPFQPLLITATYFNSFLNQPERINEGRCWQWAYLAHKTFKGVELWDICEHAFVRYRKKFYDSERLIGEADWRDLPAANFGAAGQLCPECLTGGRADGNVGASLLTETQFKYHWKSQLTRYNTTWAQLDKKAQQELRRHVSRQR